MTKRPPAPIRYLVLFGAGLCLLATVCTRSQTPAPVEPGPQAAPAEPSPAPSADPANPAADAGSPPTGREPEKPDLPTDYFPATKSPGKLF